MLKCVALFLMFLYAISVYADPISGGYWEQSLSCDDYKDSGGSWSCPASDDPSSRDPDSFEIALLKKGNLLCGWIVSTGLRTNRVDSSRVVGWITGDKAELIFASGFSSWKKIGKATIHIEDNQLYWEVTDWGEIKNGYTWGKAIAQNDDTPPDAFKYLDCEKQWTNIEHHRIDRIDFSFQ